MIRYVMLGVMAVLGVGASPQVPPQARYDLTMTVSAQDAVIAQPHLRVMGGQPGQIAFDDGAGTRFNANLVVATVGGEGVLLTSAIHAQTPATGAVEGEPSLQVALGAPAHLSFGQAGQGRVPLDVDLTITRAEP